jgi:hypothetical protein
MESGETVWGCSNAKELDSRCRQLDNLIESIRRDGYKAQNEINGGKTDDEITVCVGRDGDLLFCNSVHRLSIAKILGLETIPVKIAVRHIKWMRFRKQLSEYAIERDGKTYQPTFHPDLQHIASRHGCIDRFELIKRNLSVKEGRLLDLGANLGYFSSRFEGEGFNCIAVENIPSTIYFLTKLKRATNKHFEIIEGSIIDSDRLLKDDYDVVLALNIFHHFIKTKEKYEQFEHFLENLMCKEIYFESHNYDEAQMIGAYKNFHPEEFAELIRQKTKLKQAKYIGQAGADGRSIFKIS